MPPSKTCACCGLAGLTLSCPRCLPGWCASCGACSAHHEHEDHPYEPFEVLTDAECAALGERDKALELALARERDA